MAKMRLKMAKMRPMMAKMKLKMVYDEASDGQDTAQEGVLRASGLAIEKHEQSKNMKILENGGPRFGDVSRGIAIFEKKKVSYCRRVSWRSVLLALAAVL